MRALIFLLLFVANIPVHADVYGYFSKIKNNPNSLYAFLKEMPKGGELHYHLAGSVYPETMLAIAAKGDYCIDEHGNTIYQGSECKGYRASELVHYPQIYEQIIKAWSMKDFIPGAETGHDHFFATFYKFYRLVMNNDALLLKDIMARASNQHELYLEVMIIPDYLRSLTAAPIPNLQEGYESALKKLLANKQFQKEIDNTATTADQLVPSVRKKSLCHEKPQQAICQLQVKFQYYILREQALPAFFMQAVHGFAAAARSKDIVAINLVQPEDGIIALRDYRQQMRIIQFLHQAYPQVHIALHAGELKPADVTPADLRFHIRDAINVGKAERIGHGVDIAYEDNAMATLKVMQERGIAVEINLSSNAAILNIEGKNHPLHLYMQQHVPVVLSTDDEGILRTDLSREYVKAVQEQNVNYSDLRQFTRNVITYSFLPGKSLWQNATLAEPVVECENLHSSQCRSFVMLSAKARLQRKLEIKLHSFEERYNT